MAEPKTRAAKKAASAKPAKAAKEAPVVQGNAHSWPAVEDVEAYTPPKEDTK